MTAAATDIASIQAMVAARVAEEKAETAHAAAGAGEPFAYKVHSCADILALPRPQWRIRGVLPESGLAVIYGPSRAGKSFLALDMALAIARGADWFGWKITACPVLYVNLESSWGLQGRLTAWMRETGNAFPGNLNFIIQAFDLLNPEHVKAIIQAAPQDGMIIIDTLNRAAPGADENSSRDMGLVIKAASDIQRATGGLVLLVSHSGKDAGKGVRGHSSLFAALDACIEVDCRADGCRVFKLAKVKEGIDGISRGFQLTTVTIGTDGEGNEITSCVVEPGEARQKEDKPLTPALQYALESFNRARGKAEGVDLETWRQVFYAGHTGDKQDTKLKAFNRARKDLVGLSILSVHNDFYTRTTGQVPDKSGLSGQDTNPDGHGHTSLGVSCLSGCPDCPEVSETDGFTFEEWKVDFLPGEYGWRNIVASRDADAGHRYVPARNGGMVAVSAVRKKYALGWNGERFADSSELKDIRQKDKPLFEAICAKLGIAL